MRYSFNPKDAVLPTSGSRGAFPCSECVPNVQLASAEYVKEDGSEFIQFEWVQKKENTSLRERLYPFNEDFVKQNAKRRDVDVEWAIKYAESEYNSHLLHLLNEFDIDVSSFGDFEDFKGMAETLCSLLEAKKGKVKLYMKTVYNNKGYVDVPRFIHMGNPYIRNMKKECDLTWSEGEAALVERNRPPKGAEEVKEKVEIEDGVEEALDLFENSEPQDIEDIEEEGTAEEEAEDDLPFGDDDDLFD